MDILEIILLLAGGIVFILSFVVPAQKEEDYEETRRLAKEEIRNLVSEELEAVRGHVDDVVEEAVTYSMEKTERSLERLSNEKIMAVSEYSDTVLSEIHKNHEEVMFLYDMLNDKHINIKNTVSEVNKTVKEAAETVSEVNKTVKEAAETKREAEEVVSTFQRLAPEVSKPLKTTPIVPIELIQPQISAFVQPVEPQQPVQFPQPIKPTESQQPVQFPQPMRLAEPQQPVQFVQPMPPTEPQQPVQFVQPMQPMEPQQFIQPVQFTQPMQSAEIQQFPQMSAFVPQEQTDVKPEPAAFKETSLPTGTISFTQETDERGRNYNDVILDLYKSGKSKVAIAKELNLGVGEVNLVIDLYKNL